MTASERMIKTVAAMEDAALCHFSGHLAQDYVINEPSGELLGICLVEQAKRFAAAVKGRPHEGGTTNGKGKA